MKKITVVSLGPGPRALMTLGAVDALKKAEKIILRTRLRCDAANYLTEIGLSFDTLDDLHESCEDFDELIQAAVNRLLKEAEEKEICYGVFDASADETVKALRELAEVNVLPGVPLSAPILSAAFPQDKIEIQTASSLEITSIQNPLLILECDSKMLMGDCKLQLLQWYDPDQPVWFFPPCDGAKRTWEPIPLADLDRQKRYDHTCAALIPPVALTIRKRFDFYDLVRVMAILRGEGGCPWDREQDHQSLRKYLIEEAYETAAAIDDEDWDHVADELGDVLLQVVFQANIGRQYGTFELSDVTTHICRKMIQRHPHIFSTVHPRGRPPLMRAGKVQKKARDVGFDWNDPRDALQKVHEEADEVLAELDKKDRERLEMELGDLFFACVNVARLAGIDADGALQKATEKFISRFSAMENAILCDGKRFQDLTLSEMDVYWECSKQCARE